MGRVTATIDDDILENVDDHAEENHDGNRSAALQALVEKGLSHDDVVDDLEADLEHERARADDLRRQLQEVQSREEDVDELANYVRRERELEEQYRRASLVKRAKWWVTGMDSEDD
jgi:hypothetical protein